MDMMTKSLNKTQNLAPDNLRYGLFFAWVEMIKILFKMKTYSMCKSTFATFQAAIGQFAEGFSIANLPLDIQINYSYFKGRLMLFEN